ncbi:MAG: hypothetical protein JNN13_15095 [Planctomycetes bacterium]|nr:hypothetical protein [Planctomycetota bacterium]
MLLKVLLCLYAAFALLFAGWAVLGRGAAPDSAFALPFAEWILWLAAAGNGAIAIGGWRRAPATRRMALLLHATVAVIALLLLGRSLADGTRPAAGAVFELLAKGAVHVLLFLWWLRSRAVAARLRCP